MNEIKTAQDAHQMRLLLPDDDQAAKERIICSSSRCSFRATSTTTKCFRPRPLVEVLYIISFGLGIICGWHVMSGVWNGLGQIYAVNRVFGGNGQDGCVVDFCNRIQHKSDPKLKQANVKCTFEKHHFVYFKCIRTIGRMSKFE